MEVIVVTERERLIELLKQKQDGGSKYGDNILHETKCSNAEIADFLLENGVIVMPCSFGDTVYTISKCYYPPYFLNSNEFIVKHYISETTIKRSDIGFKNLYFTREEAEKALAEKDSE